MNTTRYPLSPFLMMTVLCIFLVSWILQNRMIVEWDLTWQVIAAQRMLQGGSYVENFFETNPPLIFFLSIPPIYIAKLLAIDIVTAIRLYFFLLTGLSLCICYPLINRIFSVPGFRYDSKDDGQLCVVPCAKRDQRRIPRETRGLGAQEIAITGNIHTPENVLRNIFFITLSIILLVIPGRELGQRDHLSLVFAMPYLLLQVLNLENIKLRQNHRLGIGLLAGIGFALKPFFAVVPLIIELYLCLVKKNPLYWLRTETITLGSFILLYLLASIIFFPDYFTVIIPYATRLYYAGMGDPWHKVIVSPLSLFSLLIISYAICAPKNNPYQNLLNILLLALIAYYLTYLAQRMLTYYHVISAYGLALLWLMTSISIILQYGASRITYLLLFLLTMAMCRFLNNDVPTLWTFLAFIASGYFFFYGLLFSLLFYFAQKQKNLLQIGLKVLFIILAACLFSQVILTTSWYIHQFLFTNILLWLLFAVFLAQEREHTRVTLFFSISVIILLAYPFYQIHLMYRLEGLRQGQHRLAKIIAKRKHDSAFFIAPTEYQTVVINYNHARLASRFPLLWMMPGLLKKERIENTPSLLQDKDFLIRMIAADINQNKPDLIFVDSFQDPYHTQKIRFDFIKYFSSNPDFVKAWRDYRFIRYVGIRRKDEVAVYARKL